MSFRHSMFATRISLGAALIGFMALPCALFPKVAYRVAMSDGIRLSTDAYFPEGSGPWPVALVRTPYGKAGGNFERRSLPWTKDGWVLVVQDTRGRGASGGANVAFEADGWAAHHDGADTLKWIAAQTWCDGRVATFGGSALGIAQLQLAGTGVSPLTAQYIQMATPSLYAGIYRQGVFRKALVEDWVQLNRYDPATLRLWTSHPSYDGFWALRDLDGRYQLIDAPAMHEGGWFDIFTQGTLDSFEGYNEHGGPHARGRQRLIMGPWTHGSHSAHAGELTFPGADAIPHLFINPQSWLDYAVKGDDNGIGPAQPVRYYVMGDTTDPHAPGNFWRTADRWPRPDSKPEALFLHSDHTAGFQPSSGHESAITWTSDPARPVPTVGGPQLPINSLLAGPVDQAIVEARSDVLVFTTDPLPKPVEVNGRMTAKVWISSDAPDTDVIVRLCVVGANGKSYNLAEGAIRARYWQSLGREHVLEPGRIYPLEIDLWSTSMVFNRGNRIRVDIASTSAPGYEVNSNNGLPAQAHGAARAAHNSLYVDPAHPSEIILPVAPFQDDGG